jgi:hypothetical protein
MKEERMFKYNLDYINLIHLSNVKGNPAKNKITYMWDGKIETQTFADSSEYDDAMDALADKFVAIGDSLYNPDRISIAKVNGLSVTFYFVGNKIIAETYADQTDVDDVVQKIDATHVEVAPNKWISGKQLHVAAANEAALEIKYEYLGGEVFDVVYEDQAAYDAAVEKLESLGEGGGGGGQKKVATPRFSPSAGNIEKGTSVTIICSTSGAAIHYTTDGTTPTSASPTYSSPIVVNADITIKAIAVKAEMTDSSVATASYVVVLPKVATPTFAPAAGEVLSGTEVAISCATTGATIYYTTDGSTPTTASTEYTAAIEVTAAVTIKAIAVKEEMTDSAVATAAYTIGIPTAAAPTFTPNGGEVAKGSTVVLATTTPGGVIHYTTNGTTPTASSPVYSDPIAINAATTIKALTVADGYKNSSVASAAYTVPATIEYYYAGVYNNPTEEEEDDHMADPITQEVLENLTNVDKGVATKKGYGSAGNEHKFDGIDEDKGGRIVYAYPKHFGALTSYITNGITGPIETSFEVATIMCGDVEYYVYYLRNATFNPYGNYAFV